MGIEVGTALAISAALSAGAAGLNAYNTNKTANRQDAAAAQSILNQGRLQAEADDKVAREVDAMAGSSGVDERAKRLDEFMTSLAANRRQARGIDAGAEYGSGAFRAANADRLAAADTAAARTAGQLAVIDAATMQREGEHRGYGRLATDLGLLKRRSAGQDWIDQLRARGIRRSAGLDFASGLMQGAAGQAAGLAGGIDSGVGPVVPEAITMPRYRVGGI